MLVRIVSISGSKAKIKGGVLESEPVYGKIVTNARNESGFIREFKRLYGLGRCALTNLTIDSKEVDVDYAGETDTGDFIFRKVRTYD